MFLLSTVRWMSRCYSLFAFLCQLLLILLSPPSLFPPFPRPPSSFLPLANVLFCCWHLSRFSFFLVPPWICTSRTFWPSFLLSLLFAIVIHAEPCSVGLHIGVNFMEKTISIRNTEITFSIWDLGGKLSKTTNTHTHINNNGKSAPQSARPGPGLVCFQSLSLSRCPLFLSWAGVRWGWWKKVFFSFTFDSLVPQFVYRLPFVIFTSLFLPSLLSSLSTHSNATQTTATSSNVSKLVLV